jgi:hypothetical protein
MCGVTKVKTQKVNVRSEQNQYILILHGSSSPEKSSIPLKEASGKSQGTKKKSGVLCAILTER